MEDQLKDLNKTLNTMMSNESRFTDKQRKQIRDKIAKKRTGRFSFLRTNWKPIMSTAVSLVLLLAIVQIAFDNMPADHASNSPDQGESSAQLATSESLNDQDQNGPSSDKALTAQESKLPKAGSEKLSPPANEDIEKTTIHEPILPLPDKLVAVYETLKAEQDQKVLKDLSAFQVMQIYFYASQNEDHETQYHMFYQDPAGVMPSKQFYFDGVDTPEAKAGTEKFLKELKKVKEVDVTYQIDEFGSSYAYITWGGTGENQKFFRLIRDQQKDVWTVTLVPMQ
ncbi:hypothetical protein [Pseudalkalibacillus berkeleyi]|uniref:Uncharacterized protein n=1 Tax=Pseudalkalibacillus berkeleyi TaxID=1069813 RepID=A0ABS9H638_9BACL|nr:hypothetical protein [Pseudalkalibacillus berkeleyi]MCF6139371.1 hypothetical protein [Pseudalkalibacillus berkeleyi]